MAKPGIRTGLLIISAPAAIVLLLAPWRHHPEPTSPTVETGPAATTEAILASPWRSLDEPASPAVGVPRASAPKVEAVQTDLATHERSLRPVPLADPAIAAAGDAGDEPDDDGVVLERRTLVRRPDSKYPLIRIEEMVEAATGTILSQHEYVADHLLVRLHAGAERAELQGRLVGSPASVRQWWGRQHLALIATTEQVPDALERLQERLRPHRDLIIGAERDAIDHLCVTPDDPRYSEMWALDNRGQSGGTSDIDIDINAPEAWDLSTGSHEILVGVLDTGVDYLHPDLQDAIWVNPREIPGNSLDDDGNGYIDDMHGWNFVSENGEPLDDRVGGEGPKGHGTHVAGTIAARGDNGVGVSGICWNARIVAAKALDAGGQVIRSDAVRAILYLNDLRAAGEPLHVVNHSWGGGGSDIGALEAAMLAGAALDILHCTAAGNSAGDNDHTPFYPASLGLPNQISVAAIDHQGALASFSNYGLASVDIAAPGVDVLNTVRTVHNGGYDTMMGTSMASPHVAGVAALAWSMLPAGSGYEIVRSAVVDSARPLAALDGKVGSGGMVDARGTLEALRGGAAGPYLTAAHPDRPIVAGPLHEITLRFSADMDQASFDRVADVVAFGGPGGSDLRAAITGHRWDDGRTLVLQCTAQRVVGSYQLVLGSGITAGGIALDQDRDGIPGETVQDRAEATLAIAGGAGPRVTGMTPILTDGRLAGFRLFFSEAMDPSSFSLASIGSLTGPAGQDLQGLLSAPDWSQQDRQLGIALSSEQDMVGRYALVLEATVASAADGSLLDQDGDGMGGESDEDVYLGSAIITGGLQADGHGYIAQGDIVRGQPLSKGAAGVQVFDFAGSFEYDGIWTHPTSGIPLGSRHFSFYGAQFDEVFLGSDAIITFGTGFTFHERSTLQVDPLNAWPREAAIALLWENWWSAGYDGDWNDQRFGEMLYRFLDQDGDSVDDALLVQVDFVATSGDTAAIQATLQLDTADQPGVIRIEFLDLDVDGQSLGSEAVAGIKDVGGQGANRLLVAYQQPDHPWIGTGKAIIYSVPGSLGGRVFADADGDGVPDPGEGGIADRTLSIDMNDDGQLDPEDWQTTSDANGYYSFLVPPGRHRLRVHDATGLSTPASGSWLVDVQAREQRTDLHVGVLVDPPDNDPPTITAGPTADPSPVLGTSTVLTVSAGDDGGQDQLRYDWTATGPAPVSFSPDGSLDAETTTASFQASGDYQITVTVTDSGGLDTQSSVLVTVQQHATSIVISP